jgi:predicted Fe-Mo cluster-binding NifX family protein
MSYKIAVASSDQINIDLNFGGAFEFLIYEVDENGTYHLVEIRSVSQQREASNVDLNCNTGCNLVCKSDGEQSNSGGCGNAQSEHPTVLLLTDCRCILCKKVGFHIQKQLEKKAIITFDVVGKIDDSIQKITTYFHRVDHHQTLRGIANQIS